MQNPWVQNKKQQIIRATVLFSGYSALLSSIEVNTTSLFFWISKRLISVAWDLLAFNVTFTGTFYTTSNTPATFGIIILDKSLENNVETVVQVLMKRSCQYFYWEDESSDL